MDDKRRSKGKVTGFYEPILERLYKLGMDAIDDYSRPTAIMLTFSLEESFVDYPISAVIDRLRDKLRKAGKNRKKANTFKLKYLWCHELKFVTVKDPEFQRLSKSVRSTVLNSISDDCPIPYPHYHIILFMDAKKATYKSIQVAMDKLVSEGIVRPEFHISKNNTTKIREMILSSPEGFAEYFYRAAYLAKSDTKDPSSARFWASSNPNK